MSPLADKQSRPAATSPAVENDEAEDDDEEGEEEGENGIMEKEPAAAGGGFGSRRLTIYIYLHL